MARVNLTIPDDVVTGARAAGLNLSAVASAALRDEVERLEKCAALDAYLDRLESELGPIPDEEMQAAQTWIDSWSESRLASKPRGR